MDIKIPPLSQSINKIETRGMHECSGFITTPLLPYSIPKNQFKNQNTINSPVHAAPAATSLPHGEGIFLNNDILMIHGNCRSGGAVVQQSEDSKEKEISFRHVWFDVVTSEHGPAKPTTRLVCLGLFKHMDSDGFCFPSYDKLIKNTGIKSRSTISAGLECAESEEWIIRLSEKDVESMKSESVERYKRYAIGKKWALAAYQAVIPKNAMVAIEGTQESNRFEIEKSEFISKQTLTRVCHLTVPIIESWLESIKKAVHILDYLSNDDECEKNIRQSNFCNKAVHILDSNLPFNLPYISPYNPPKGGIPFFDDLHEPQKQTLHLDAKSPQQNLTINHKKKLTVNNEPKTPLSKNKIKAAEKEIMDCLCKVVGVELNNKTNRALRNRLKEGATIEQCKQVIFYHRDLLENGNKEREHFNSNIFRLTRWNNALMAINGSKGQPEWKTYNNPEQITDEELYHVIE